MLSIARSRMAVPSQLLFLALNGCGIFFGIFFNVNTPDLYANNAHHKIGWVATWVVTAQVAMSLLSAFSGWSKKKDASVSDESAPFLPISIEAMAQQQQLHNQSGYKDVRWSRDSGQGTECASSSEHSRDLSVDDTAHRRQEHERYLGAEAGNEDDEDEKGLPKRQDFFHSTSMHKFLKRRIPGLFSQRASQLFEIVYDGIDRIILVLGFIALVTGGVTYAGIFVSKTASDGFPSELTICSARTMFSTALHISSKVAFSSGTAS